MTWAARSHGASKTPGPRLWGASDLCCYCSNLGCSIGDRETLNSFILYRQTRSDETASERAGERSVAADWGWYFVNMWCVWSVTGTFKVHLCSRWTEITVDRSDTLLRLLLPANTLLITHTHTHTWACDTVGFLYLFYGPVSTGQHLPCWLWLSSVAEFSFFNQWERS